MDSILKKSVRNSELKIAKNKRAFLTYPSDGLVPCTIEEADDEIVFLFNTTDLEPMVTIIKEPILENQYRFLINCAALYELSIEYDFSLSLDNLMIDINLRPRILSRDYQPENADAFLPRYKALIGSVLLRKYKYEDYLNGGSDLYKKHKLVKELSSFETVDDIKNLLLHKYKSTVRKNQETKVTVSKRNVLVSRITIPILTIALAATAFFGFRSVFQDVPYKDSVIAAKAAYIGGDYIAVMQALENMELSDLTYESKHILARSYVITEALTNEQKENALQGLTLKTDSVIFDYWITQGRLQFDEAIDIAQRLGDDELLLFVYMKYEVLVKNDTTMSGEEKTRLLSELDGKINSLRKAREDSANAVSAN